VQSLRSQSGQVTAEFVMICVSMVLTLVLVGYGTSHSLCNARTGLAEDQCGNTFVEIGSRLSDSLAAVTTLISLPF